MKAVITAAGLNTGRMPLGKVIPKEMMPVGNKPALQLVVEELLSNGIKDILVVVGQGRRTIQEHFESDPTLENLLRKKGMSPGAEEIRKLSGVSLHYITQPEPTGLGNAILCAKDHVGDEAFLLILGDDIVIGGDENPTSQLLMAHRGSGKTIIGVKKSKHKPTRGAVITGDQISPSPPTYLVSAITNKTTATEGHVTMGRYLLNPTIFDILEDQKETTPTLELTHALDHIAKKEGALAVEHEGKHYDMGNPNDWLEANKRACKSG